MYLVIFCSVLGSFTICSPVYINFAGIPPIKQLSSIFSIGFPFTTQLLVTIIPFGIDPVIVDELQIQQSAPIFTDL